MTQTIQNPNLDGPKKVETMEKTKNYESPQHPPTEIVVDFHQSGKTFTGVGAGIFDETSDTPVLAC